MSVSSRISLVLAHFVVCDSLFYCRKVIFIAFGFLSTLQSGMSNSLLPEEIAKEMKTEDEILAQMRASQGDPSAQSLTFISDALNPEDAFTVGTNIAPNLEELQKLIGSDIHVSRAETAAAAASPVPFALVAAAGALPTLQRPRLAATTENPQAEKVNKAEPIPEVSAKQQISTKTTEVKSVKQTVKVEEKPAKKDPVAAKTKNKKLKEEKKDDTTEVMLSEGEKKTSECLTAEDPPQHFGSRFYDNVIKRLQKRPEELPLENTDEQKRSDEPSLLKNKKDDKPNKKDLEKEKKEWLKDGFTIVKGTEKKDNKKKEKEEARAAEEADKKRKDEEKKALIEAEKNRAPEPVTRRQQLEIGQTQRQQSQTQIEQAPKKAPWSAQSSSRDGLALSDIQRLEREKKLEQMKEQQQMMQVIAQQQAAAAQREQQELQAGQMGWAKKKQPNAPPGQTLAEIQAEARKQAAAIAAAATAAAAREEAQPTPPPVNAAPWTATNGGGFWDSPAPGTLTAKYESKITESTNPKVSEPKPKKKVTVVAPSKKEVSPSADFETWCTNVLSNWKDAANIDIPTFVAFLREIESPYEVKDYVKCYLGDTKESNDFSRQFLERRSRLLRVGMVTPSDDLCAPAVAVNPRTNSGSDYTEVKSKGNKKTKKNKMLKIDARILGFSVTASEDRINIGDIDTV